MRTVTLSENSVRIIRLTGPATLIERHIDEKRRGPASFSVTHDLEKGPSAKIIVDPNYLNALKDMGTQKKTPTKERPCFAPCLAEAPM